MKIHPQGLKRWLADSAAQLQQLGASGEAAITLVLPRDWPQTEAPLLVRVRTAGGAAQTRRVTDLRELNVPPGTRAQVWSPAADTLLTSVKLPTRSRSKIQQALPFALEDQLAGEPEDMHFAYQVLGQGELAVAVTARERLNAWREAFALSGIGVQSLAPLTLGLARAEGAWSALWHEGHLVVRTGEFSGFEAAVVDAAPPAILLAALRDARAQGKAPSRMLVHNAPTNFSAAQWSAILELPVEPVAQDFWRALTPTASLNLLAGEASATGTLHPVLPRLKPAAIMLSIWIAGSFLFDFWQWWGLSREAKRQRSEMTEIFRRAFPDAKTIVDPALQMQRNVAQLQGMGGGPGDFLPLLAKAAPALQASDGAVLQGAQYGTGALTLELQLADFQMLEGLKRALEGRGLKVETVGANSRASGVEGKLRVTPQGGA